MHLKSDSQPWYKEPWPWLLMLGPCLVIIAGVITTWLAIRSNDGLVADDYYKQGLAINQQLQREQHAGELGLHADIMRADRNLRVVLSGTDRIALPEKLNLHISHPTRAGLDQNLVLSAEGAGVFVGQLSADLDGRWHVALEDSSGQWRLHGDWQAGKTESVRLVAAASPAGGQPKNERR